MFTILETSRFNSCPIEEKTKQIELSALGISTAGRGRITVVAFTLWLKTTSQPEDGESSSKYKWKLGRN